jgi:hypothetical protein
MVRPALKMYANERNGENPEEYPLRFLPMIEDEKFFDDRDGQPGVDMFASISAEQVAVLTDI